MAFLGNLGTLLPVDPPDDKSVQKIRAKSYYNSSDTAVIVETLCNMAALYTLKNLSTDKTTEVNQTVITLGRDAACDLVV